MRKFQITCSRIKKQSKYKLFFQFHPEVVDKLKKLPIQERKWVSEEKCWIVTTRGLYDIIKSYKGSDKIIFDFGEDRLVFKNQITKIELEKIAREKLIKELNEKKNYWVNIKQDFEKNYLDYTEKVHANLKNNVKLYAHQIVAAMFLNETKSALLALDMGTGKTLAAIAYVEMNNFSKVFVITPNSLKFNFYNEVIKFTNSKAHIINWKKNEYSIEESKYIIVNYEFFNTKDKKKFLNKFKSLNLGEIDCVIADECHRLKNSSSNTYKNYKKIFKDKIFRDNKTSKIFLSGTPAPNKAHELYNILHEISPIDFATKQHFLEYYCGITYQHSTDDNIVWEVDKTKQRLEELFHKIAPFTYRKKKEEILDLPDKIYQKIILELSPIELNKYLEIEEGVANEIFETETIHHLTIMTRLRKYTSVLKIKSIKEIVDNLLEENKKVVIIDTFKIVLNELHKMYPKISCLHTGDKSVEERTEMVNKFQDENSEIKIFLATSQTANYGLTLTAASNMIIVTLPYSLGEYKQVADRIHRISQKNTVNIFPLIFRDTIDEYVFDSLEEKQQEVSKVIDNEDYESNVRDNVLSDVINKLRNKYT